MTALFNRYQKSARSVAECCVGAREIMRGQVLETERLGLWLKRFVRFRFHLDKRLERRRQSSLSCRFVESFDKPSFY